MVKDKGRQCVSEDGSPTRREGTSLEREKFFRGYARETPEALTPAAFIRSAVVCNAEGHHEAENRALHRSASLTRATVSDDTRKSNSMQIARRGAKLRKATSSISPTDAGGAAISLDGTARTSTYVTGTGQSQPAADQTDPRRVFISYNRRDTTAAQQISDTLRQAGYVVFRDVEVQAGQYPRFVIERELTHADATVVLWSQHSVSSRWVLDEAEAALEIEAYFPVVIDDLPRLPMGFGPIKTVNLAGWLSNDTTSLPQDFLDQLARFIDNKYHTD